MKEVLKLVGLAILTTAVHLSSASVVNAAGASWSKAGISSSMSAVPRSVQHTSVQAAERSSMAAVPSQETLSPLNDSQPFNGDGVPEGGPSGTQGSGTR